MICFLCVANHNGWRIVFMFQLLLFRLLLEHVAV